MVGLEGTRVVVLDDEEREAMAVIRALSVRQIPAVWFTGSRQELPAEGKPLQNVRLALLDVDLTGGGSDDNQLANTLAAVVKRLFPLDAAGLAIVLWTKHPEVRDLFLDRLLSSGGPAPVFVEVLSKSDYLDPETGTFELQKLGAKLEERLQALEPWPALLEWEQEAREASGNVVSGLAHLAQGSKPVPTRSAELGEWQTEVGDTLGAVLARLAREEFGADNVRTGSDYLQAAYTAIGPLLHDQTETQAHGLAERRGARSSQFFERVSKIGLSRASVAQVNTRLSIASVPGSRSWSGNIYELKTGRLQDAFDKVYSLTAYRSAVSNMLANASFSTDAAAIKKRAEMTAKINEAILSIVAVDVNPPCDHAQSKVECGRFVTGIVLTSDVARDTRIVKKVDSVWELGPLIDQEDEREYHLLFDLRRPLVTPKDAIVEGLAPKWRLRQSYITELLSRIGVHGARPGTLMLRV